ncbi:MAG TPA: periplasmic heavy metal sensor [Verrucomicrobiales bacterium]|nr:periplasmic heavy metal sensor [Verrucomicrobiales bacterium]
MKISLLLSVFILFTASAPALDLTGLVTPETISAHHEALDLSPEQEAELTQIYEAAKSEAATLETAVREAEKQLTDLLKEHDVTSESTDARLDALLEAEAKLKKLKLRTLITLRSKLSPGQLKMAITFASEDKQESVPLEAQIEVKANRLKAAFDELGFTPGPALKQRGEDILELIRNHELSAADEALNKLITETGLDAPIDSASIDFSTSAPGETDLEVLKQRFEQVETKAKSVVFLPTLRQLIKGRDALELAKANEDAEQVGRILTWAENLLDPSASGQ